MSAMVVYLWNKSLLEKIKSEAEINDAIYQLVKDRYTRKTLKYIKVNPNGKVGHFILESDPIDKIGATASGIAGTKIANKINNLDLSQPKDFYKGKIGAAVEFATKKGSRYILTAVEKTEPAFWSVTAWEVGQFIGNYIAGTWNVLTGNCVNGVNCQ